MATLTGDPPEPSEAGDEFTAYLDARLREMYQQRMDAAVAEWFDRLFDPTVRDTC